MSEQYGYKVHIESHQDSYTHDGKQWGSWSSSTSHSFKGVEKVTEYPDVTSIHDFKEGDIAYLVWAVWSTGDSFGHGTGAYSEAFALLKDAQDAFNLATALRHATKNSQAKWDDKYGFKWVSSDGQVVESGFLPWLGYFESLDDVFVETVQIGVGMRHRF